MTDTVTIGKRLISLEHIALVEAFDPAANPDFKSDRDFKSRFILIDRECVLAEITPTEFAEKSGFRMLPEDGIATNPALHFSVESFSPGEGFNPSKPFASRLSWKNTRGNGHSKLLLTPPERVLAISIRGEASSAEAEAAAPAVRRPARGRRRPAPTGPLAS